MSALPLLVIGPDPAWRSRMQGLLAARGEFEWLGAYAPAQPRPDHAGLPALLLLDGDDRSSDRRPRRPWLPAPRRLYFYRRPDAAALLRCIAARASACLGKSAPPELTLRAIRAAGADLFVTMPGLLQDVRGADAPAPPAVAAAPSPLTGRQREIVRWAVRGLSNKQIARQLGISPETVKTHLHHVFERRGVHNRVALLGLPEESAAADAARGS